MINKMGRNKPRPVQLLRMYGGEVIVYDFFNDNITVLKLFSANNLDALLSSWGIPEP